MKRLKEIHTKEDIDFIHKEFLVWLKNVQRIKTVGQYKEFLYQYTLWLQGYFFDSVMKNIAGYGTIHLDHNLKPEVKSKIEKYYNYFAKAFIPTALDVKRVENEMGYNLHTNYADLEYWIENNIVFNIMFPIKFNCVKQSKSIIKNNIYRGWIEPGTLFEFWERLNKTSKYNSIKKKIDEFFDIIEKEFNYGYELSIQDTMKIDNVLINIDSSKYLLNNSYNVIPYIKETFKLIKSKKLSKSLYGLQSINILPISSNSKSKNVVSGVDFGTGAVYRNSSKEIDIYEGRMQRKDGFIEGLTHEIGHHYFFHILDDARKKQWIQFYDDLKSGELLIERRKLIEEMKKFHTFITDERKNFEHNVQAIISNGGSRKDVENIKDYNKYKTFSMSLYEFPLLVEYVTTLDSNYGTMIIQQLNDYARILRENEMYKNYGVYSDEDMQMAYNMFAQSVVTGIDILQTLAPSYYATKNYHELFAETFAAYCLRGTNIQYNLKLDDIVFRTFIDITNVRSATHEKVMHESTVTLKTLPKYQFLGIEEGEHVCEFCNRKHILYMYVVRDLDTGDIFRFGSTCIKKALGISSEDLKKVNKEFMKEYIEKFNQVTIPEYNKRRNSALNDFINDGKGDKYDWQLTKEYKDFEKEYNDIYQKYYDTMKIYK
jgi:hypothetical protein